MLEYRPLILIPSYNTGPLLAGTVRSALDSGMPVWVVVDGSTDDSDKLLDLLDAAPSPDFQVMRLARNRGKGGALLAALEKAVPAGYTHVLCMDADGQHPANHIPTFFSLSARHPEAAILGRPVFDSSAPALRVNGRKISNFFTNFESLGWGIDDSLFGMRLYPAKPLLEAFYSTRYARRFDFEPEIAVRLAWKEIPFINLPTPVRYIPQEEGGVSQFRYLRDNVLLTWMHARLLGGFLLRLPLLLLRGHNPLDHLSPP
ncbi:MAG: glycosyltransferase family 2 protein [Verrucomicrobiota bacterium]